jgi:hypothetical protein
MVTPMTEQSGPSDPSERQGTERQRAERQGAERQGAERQGAEPPGRGRPGTDRLRQSPSPRPDLIGDLNRWLIRQGAKNVRKEIGGQVRRTFGGGRSATADVWDTVTNEIPPAEGEAPECQWCPICRAARRMRESGPGIGGQLSGAGEAVASAVQDAFNALDGLLSKTGGGNAQRDTEPQRAAPHGTGPHGTGPHGTAPHGTGPQEIARPESARQAETDLSRGAAGWPSPADPWSTATEADVREPGDSESGTRGPGTVGPDVSGSGASDPSASDPSASDPSASDPSASDPAASVADALDAEAPHANSDPGTQHDGRGHEPDDRS